MSSSGGKKRPRGGDDGGGGRDGGARPSKSPAAAAGGGGADGSGATIGQQTSHIRNKLVRSETYAKLKHKQKVRLCRVSRADASRVVCMCWVQSPTLIAVGSITEALA